MKKITLLILFFTITIIYTNSYSQSAVYFCNKTGAVGFAYGYSYNEVIEMGKEACIEFGGQNPQLVVATQNKGYGAIVLGKDENGSLVVGAAVGISKYQDAVDEAFKACNNLGARDANLEKTWHDK
ncbi:MAG: hypothetical protein JW917_05945 [Ignavibacteria bacterium]|nr:hypothetical protein [Ignavibacteria bacterium]